MTRIMKWNNWAIVALAAGALAVQGASVGKASKPLAEKIRHELVMLPQVSVFDDIRYEVDGSTVILTGSVVRPILKSDAENVVKSLEGIDMVRNEIKILPLSPFDNQIRLAAARAIYAPNALGRYALSPVPSVRILVENGNITLTGVVANEFDRNLANLKALGVAGAFSVTNDLRVE